MFEPRFHAVIYTWHFQPHINPVWTSYKVATKTFHVIQGPLNTFRLVACFLHEISTGLYFMTFAAGLFEQNWAKKQIWLNLQYFWLWCGVRTPLWKGRWSCSSYLRVLINYCRVWHCCGCSAGKVIILSHTGISQHLMHEEMKNRRGRR